MDFDFSPEHRALERTARTFVAESLPKLPPSPSDFAREACAELGARDLLATRSMVGAVTVVLELASGSPPLGAVAATALSFADALEAGGGPAWRGLLDRVRGGQAVPAVALDGLLGKASEASPRLASASGVLVLSGAVSHVALSPLASHAVVAARSPDAPRPAVVVVELDAPGVSRHESTSTFGLDAVPRGALHFDGVALDPSAVLAEGSAGGSLSRSLLDAETLLVSAVSLGVGRRAFDAALAHVRAHKQRPTQTVEFSISDIATELDAATLSVLHAAWLRDEKQPHSVESAGAKLVATRSVTRIAHRAVGIVGEAGYADVLRQCYLDARFLEIHAGTDAELEDRIASDMLGES
jgi:alkylation response protein AidB-like acyl-CoA dehydrogenase